MGNLQGSLWASLVAMQGTLQAWEKKEENKNKKLELISQIESFPSGKTPGASSYSDCEIPQISAWKMEDLSPVPDKSFRFK